MAWVNPKLDWLTNPVNPTKTDMNRIESNIDFINTDIETKKGAIVSALSGVGVATLLTDTHAAIAAKIVAAEKTGVSITPSAINQPIPNGIYDTGGGVVVGDADLVAGNIVPNKNIFGVVGNFNPITKIVQGYAGPYGSWEDTAYNITIPSVNLASSIVLIRFASGPRSENSKVITSAVLTSATNLQVTLSSEDGGLYFGYTIIEFNPLTVKSLQKGVAVIDNLTTVIISPVVIAKSLIFLAGGQTVSSAGTSNGDPTSYLAGGMAKLTATNTITFYENNYGGYPTTGSWQVIEFY